MKDLSDGLVGDLIPFGKVTPGLCFRIQKAFEIVVQFLHLLWGKLPALLLLILGHVF